MMTIKCLKTRRFTAPISQDDVLQEVQINLLTNKYISVKLI